MNAENTPPATPRRTRIKVCGFTRAEDALAAVEAGVDAIGLVFHPPSPRCIDPERAAIIIRALPPFVSAVALFVDARPDTVRAIREQIGFDLAQYHGDETPEQCAAAGVPWMKALRVRPGLDLLHCAARFRDARGLLLDAFEEGVPGGTGRRFDWSLIPSGLPLPLVLSGGLDPGNVAEAVRRVRPFAVDVSSGVESGKGIKCADRIRAFVREVRNEDV